MTLAACAADESDASGETSEPVPRARDAEPIGRLGDAAVVETDLAVPANDATTPDAGTDAAPMDAMLPVDVPPAPPATQCANGQDDDEDGRADLDDGDCASAADPTEQGDRPPTACTNGVDDDADDRTDWPEDPGCVAAGDGDEADPAAPPACANTQDDDADGVTDYPAEPGCQGRGDDDETDPTPTPACANGEDDDGDGATDYPEDFACTRAAGSSEVESGGCGAGRRILDLSSAVREVGYLDADLSSGSEGFVGSCGGAAGPELVLAYRLEEFVGALEFTTAFPETTVPTVMYVRTTCDAPMDLACNRSVGELNGTDVRLPNAEPGVYYIVVDTSLRDRVGAVRVGVNRVEAPRCSDRRDNDQDGAVDLADPGCLEGADDDETDPAMPPECADGMDNDGDGQTDYPGDPQCEAAGEDREADAACMLADDLILFGQEGGFVRVDTTMNQDLYDGGCNSVGPEQIIAVVIDEAPVTIIVDLQNETFDTAIFARRACDDPGTELTCNDDFNGLASHIEFRADVPGAYYVFIGAFSSPARTGQVDVTVTVL
jgi:hypothetical protein